LGKATARPATRDQKAQIELKNRGEIPHHIAIIMDGNGRWAQRRGMPRIAGHKAGVESVRDIVEACGQLGVKYLTLYAFSTENWRRPEDEVSMLMRLLLRALRDETDRLQRNNVRLMAIGDMDTLPPEVRRELDDGIHKTSGNTGLTLVLALSYSGRWDITSAVRRLVGEAAAGRLAPEAVDEKLIGATLSTEGIPDPDLLVRSSGELRISNFLLWQLAYSEIYVTRTCWPSFRREELYDAVRDFQNRERRFGMVSAQIDKKTRLSGFVRKVTDS
jgi:undecaprenyl diphosphate synthase